MPALKPVLASLLIGAATLPYVDLPATTWSHSRLCRLPPLLGFASAELVMNVEELGCHETVNFRDILG